MKNKAEFIRGFRLSPQQRQIWSQNSLPNQKVGKSWLVKGNLEPDFLLRAVKRVIKAHEILRTDLILIDGVEYPFQVIRETIEFNFEYLEADDYEKSLPALVYEKWLEGLFEENKIHSNLILQLNLIRIKNDEYWVSIIVPAGYADEPSFNNILKDMEAAYIAIEKGLSSSDLERVQYTQFSEWQNECQDEKSDLSRMGREYWKEILSKSAISLPEQKIHNTKPEFLDKFKTYDFEENKTGKIHRLAEKLGSKPGLLIFAAWTVLLWKLTNTGSFRIGFICNERKYEELDEVVGLLSKPVPFVCQVIPKFDFKEYFEDFEKELKTNLNWQEYYFHDEHHPAGTDNNSHHSPHTGQIAVELMKKANAVWSNGILFKADKVSFTPYETTLKLDILEDRESPGLQFNYDSSQFTEDAVDRLKDYLTTLLTDVLEFEGQRKIESLQILSPKQIEQITVGWNKTDRTFSAFTAVHKLFENQVKQTPQAVAVRDRGTEISFHELNQKSNQIAAFLTAKGIKSEDKIGITAKRGIKMIAGILGILKAGGAYVPVETKDAPERFRHILQDAEIKFLLIFEPYNREDISAELETISLDEILEQQTDHTENPEIPVVGENIAYLMYTSGSTGKPKGTLVTHNGLCNYLEWANEYYKKSVPVNALLHTPIVFDLSLTSLFLPLITGGTIFLAPEENAADALLNGLAQWTVEDPLLKITPAHLEILKDSDFQTESLPGKKQIVIGGEALFAESLKSWFEIDRTVRFYNEYGPTETVVGCSVEEITATDDIKGAVPIGKPIANTQMYILDDRMNPVPVGVSGEIFIGGSGVARGYHKRPDLTAEKFVPNPFNENGKRLYKTGDIGKFLSDGTILYSGRNDQQIKIQGYRIELGEIESALYSHPDTVEAVVLHNGNKPSADGETENQPGNLTAFIALRDENIKINWVEFLKAKLPDYMVPASFVQLAGLPLAKNGKIDKKLLAETYQNQRLEEKPESPRNLKEEILAGIWAEVLNLETVGINQNFFDLGGDSMRSIQIRARAKKRGLNVEHEQLFNYRTIKKLARHLNFTSEDGIEKEFIEPFALINENDRKLIPDEIEDAFPLAMLQAGMVFHSELNPQAAIFHDVHSFHIKAGFDESLMKKAISDAMRRHEILRVSFDMSSFTEPLQLVHKNPGIPLKIEDISSKSESEKEEYLNEWSINDRQNRFEWNKSPLLRFHVHLQSENSFQFTMSFHHAILDGWSAASLLTELFKNYLYLLENRVLPEPEAIGVNYRDFVALEQKKLKSPESREFWLKKLDDVIVTKLPRLKNENKTQTGIAIQTVELSEEVSDGLKKAARAVNVPVKSVLLAAHLLVMKSLSGRTDIITGLVSNGRLEEEGGDQALGLFLNTVPFRLNLSGGAYYNLVEQVFELEKDIFPHRRFPLAELQRLTLAGQSLFETSFNFMHYHVYESVGELNEVQVLGYNGYEETNFTLTANFSQDIVTNRVRLGLNYHKTEITEKQIQNIADYYQRILTRMAENPQSRYEAFSPLSEPERRQIIESWNATEREYEAPGFVVEQISRQARAHPEAVAVQVGERLLSYSELDRQSNQLARFLRSLGVGCESRVGVMLERSAELVVSLLGVLKAGGGYVPLDPGYPRRRLEYMAHDAGLAVVISRGGQWEAVAGALDDALEPVRVVDWERDREEIGNQSEAALSGAESEQISGGQMAYMIYTSGSTGVPKGAVNTHEAMFNRLEWMRRHYRVTADDRILQKTPVSFDVSVWELFLPLVAGGRLVLAVPGGHRDSAYLVREIIDKQITMLHFVPSMLQVFIEEDGVGGCRSVRQLISSGEALTGELATRTTRRLGTAALDNLYGPTEAAVDVTYWRCAKDEAAARANVPLGTALDNVRMYVLDERFEVVPAGVRGEIFIGGVQVGRGYWRKADLTAEKFVPDLYAKQAGSRMYRTGDYGRYDEQGVLEYLGRVDEQVKIRGNRIEIGEIEAVLEGCAGVRQAAVRVWGESGQEQLVGYLVTEDGEELEAGRIRTEAGARLPEYMIPGMFVQLAEMPLSVNGKIERKSLPKPEAGELKAGEYAGAETATEAKLVEVWEEVLAVKPVGIDDNFFLLGGHSLIVTQLVSRIRAIWSVELPLRTFFEATTIRELAKLIDSSQSDSTKQSAVEQITIEKEELDIDALLTELEEMSIEESESLLENESE